MKNKYILAITAYNCEIQIQRVLDNISVSLEQKLEEIIVINNRSTDNTENVVLNYISNGRLKKLKLFRNDENYSLGGSHKVIFLRGEEIGATHVIILHGDDQANASEVIELIKDVENGNSKTVLGSRFNKKSILIGYDWKRIFGNRSLNVVFSILTRRRIEDLGSGLNVFALSDLNRDRYLNFSNKLTFNFELLLDLVDRGINFSYHPITWREEDQVSNAKNFNIAWTGLKNILTWKFRRDKFFSIGEKKENYTYKEIE